jgi:hypothetical protein
LRDRFLPRINRAFIVNCTERKVRLIGEVALVTGHATIEAEIGG